MVNRIEEHVSRFPIAIQHDNKRILDELFTQVDSMVTRIELKVADIQRTIVSISEYTK